MHEEVMRAAVLLVATALAPVSAMAQSQSVLPIPVGIWVEQPQTCDKASNVWIFDGQRIGDIYFYANPRMSQAPQGSMESISRIRRLPNGYTEFKPESFGEVGRLRVKAIGPGRVSREQVAPYREGLDVSETTLTLCKPESLPPRMQAAVRRLAPALAAPASAGPAPVKAAGSAPSAGLTAITVRLTPRAQKRVAALKEQVLVRVDIEAEPVRNTPRDWYLDEITVSLGEQQVTLPAAGGVASIGVPPRLAQRAGRVRPGSEIVRIAVTSARKTQVDNILGCASVTSELGNLPKAVTIDCDLIG